MPVPWQNLEALDLLGRIAAIGRPATVVDWGCGMNHGPISSQVRQLQCDRLVSIDVWPEYVSKVLAEPYAAKEHHCYCTEILQFAALAFDKHRHYDLSLCLDIVEHFEKSSALDFLALVEGLSSHVLIWIPLGYAPITYDTYGGDNDYWHTHRSTWGPEELERLGYAVEVLENFHTPMFGHKVDGGWAYKRVGGQ